MTGGNRNHSVAQGVGSWWNKGCACHTRGLKKLSGLPGGGRSSTVMTFVGFCPEGDQSGSKDCEDNS
jgi:hypothetical protein